MDLKDVFLGVVVVLVCLIALLSWTGTLNQAYNTEVTGSFNNTLTEIQTELLSNVSDIGLSVGGTVEAESGVGEGDVNQGLLKKSVSAFRFLGKLIGIVPSLFSDFAGLLGIPSPYAEIGGWTFALVFGLAFAFIIVQAIRAIIPG